MATATADPKKADTRTPTEKLGVEVGMIVHWYPDGLKSERPLAAMVNAVNPWSVQLHLFPQNTYTLPVRDGVRHIEDGTLKETDRLENGAWDFTPQHKELQALKEQIAKLLA